MRRRILALVAATVLLVLVAFAVPLAVLIRTVAEDTALSTATAQAQSLTPVVATADRTPWRRPSSWPTSAIPVTSR